MTYVYPSAQRLLAELNGVWTDLTDYWVEDLTGSWGIQGNGPLDLLAETGVLRVVLNNMDQRFDPESATALAGWGKGIRMKLEIDYDGETYVHAGTIGDISVPISEDLVDKAFVTIMDWMEYAAKQPIVNPGILTNQRGDDVIRTVLGLMPIQPAASDLDVGISIFPTTFDTVTSKTKAYSEFSKVTLSEPGYIYLRKDKTLGETLVFESAHARHGWRALDLLPLAAVESGFLLKEDGGYLLKEDGGRIILDQATQLTMDNTMLAVDSDYGKDVINYFTVRANPRRYDTSVQILFKLDQPLPISTGQTIRIKGNYADPAGGSPISGNNMIVPTTPTDYKAWTNSNGTGIDISASIVLDSTPFGGDGFTHAVRNNQTYPGWITQYNVRGFGIYNYNPIEHVEQNGPSIDSVGNASLDMDQKYQVSLEVGRVFAAQVIEDKSKPRTDVNKITFLANESATMMMAALNFGPGNLIRAINTRRNIDSYFYIQGVSEFKVTPGGLIMCTFLVKKVLSLLLGLSTVAVEFGGFSSVDAIDFGYLPATSNLTTRTFSAWIYPKSTGSPQDIITIFGEEAGMLVRNATGGNLEVRSKMFGNLDLWTANAVFTANNWYHVVVTYDVRNYPASPIAYVNGALVAWSSSSITGGGAMLDETGISTIIGNENTSFKPYTDRAFNGIIKDARIYDRILSAAEVTTLYNSGVPNAALVTEGLVFQAFAVRTKELSQYVNITLTDALKVLDNMFGAVGTPHGAPIGRSF